MEQLAKEGRPICFGEESGGFEPEGLCDLVGELWVGKGGAADHEMLAAGLFLA